MATHNELGEKGEQLAVEYLQQKGYKILERNWRFKKAEVDIIALKDDILVPVEVKTRTSNYFGNPQDFVNLKKIQLLVEAINEYVVSKDLDVEVRFDIVAIIQNKNTTKIEYLQDAFLHF